MLSQARRLLVFPEKDTNAKACTYHHNNLIIKESEFKPCLIGGKSWLDIFYIRWDNRVGNLI